MGSHQAPRVRHVAADSEEALSLDHSAPGRPEDASQSTYGSDRPSPASDATRVTDPAGAPGGASSDGSGEAEEPRAPGLKDRLGSTRGAAIGLAKAHIDLLKAEAGEILGQVKTIAALGGVALVLGLFVGNLLFTGLWLFLGEWLFGSLGWGLLHGVLFGAGTITAVILILLGMKPGTAISRLLIALVIGALVAVLLGSNILQRIAAAAADAVRTSVPTLDPLWAPTIVGALGLGLILGVVFLILGARGGAKGAIGGLVAGLVLGALIGAFLGGSILDWKVAAAIGVTIAGVLWIVLQLLSYKAQKLDPGERFRNLYPRVTIDTAKETKDWVKDQWANRRSKLGRG